MCHTNSDGMTIDKFKQYDYEEFTGQCPLWQSKNNYNIGLNEQIRQKRLNIEEFQNEIIKLKNKPYVILDVRPKVEYELAHISGNIK